MLLNRKVQFSDERRMLSYFETGKSYNSFKKHDKMFFLLSLKCSLSVLDILLK